MSSKFLKRYAKIGALIILIMHSVGAVGFAMDKNYFVGLTPIHLWVINSVLCLPLISKPKYFLVLMLIATLGFLIEALGVETGLVFGTYSYGKVLGYRVLEVPILIGFNWATLLIAAYSLVQPKLKSSYFGALIIGLIVMGIDFLIEPVAISNGYWSWSGGVIPVQNYVAWFFLSFLLALILYRTKFPRLPLLLSLSFLSVQALFFIYLQFVLP